MYKDRSKVLYGLGIPRFVRTYFAYTTGIQDRLCKCLQLMVILTLWYVHGTGHLNLIVLVLSA